MHAVTGHPSDSVGPRPPYWTIESHAYRTGGGIHQQGAVYVFEDVLGPTQGELQTMLGHKSATETWDS